jgi:hypothetical protein
VLLLVLLCVVASFGMLVLALFTGGTGWAWGSVAASVIGGALLVFDWLTRRRAAQQPPPAVETDPGADEEPRETGL